MKHTSMISGLTAGLVATLWTLAPLPARADGKDDKKPMAQAPAGSDEYRLGPGDKLRIEVYKDPQLSQSVQVRPDGKITLPLVGDLDATKRTPI